MTKTSVAAIGLTFAMVGAACAGSSEGPGRDPADLVPSTSVVVEGHSSASTVEFVRFDGSSASLDDYMGAPLVVNFWASWCPSCVAEMAAAFRPVQEAVGDTVAFLGMNLQDERAAALRMVEETGVLFELAEDPIGELYVDLEGIGMPFTVFIDERGRIVERHNGPLTEAQLLDAIEAAFGL